MKYIKNEKKNVKKVVSDAQSEAYGDLYNKLGSREWEIFQACKNEEKEN